MGSQSASGFFRAGRHDEANSADDHGPAPLGRARRTRFLAALDVAAATGVRWRRVEWKEGPWEAGTRSEVVEFATDSGALRNGVG